MNLLKKHKLIKYKNKNINYFYKKGNLIIENNSDKHGFLILPKIQRLNNEKVCFEIEGKVIEGNSSLFCLMDFKKNIILETSLNTIATTEKEVKNCLMSIKVLPFSKVKISKMKMYNIDKDYNIFENLCNDILIITPNYPTLKNKYMCAFVHSRLVEYKKSGIKFDVICCHDYVNSIKYNFEGIDVIRTNFANTRKHLQRKKYKKILVHFFDEKYANIFDSLNLNETEFLFWVHGPETLYWDWPKFTTPYFSKEMELNDFQKKTFTQHDKMIKRYNEMNNVKWIFVSNWIKEQSEKLIGIKFNNYCVIPNIVNEEKFKYYKKDIALRKNIFFVRRFDDCNKYAIDINVKTILELSKRDFFKDLTFNIYGIGNLYNELIYPIKKFENVNLYPKFLSHDEISEVHSKNGIGLFATRYDSQGVSMCEAASSGLVIVTSDNLAIKEFLNNDLDIFADVEIPKQYADIIEKLYLEPKTFEKYSKECSDSIFRKCCYENTILKEINIIKKEFIVNVSKIRNKKIDIPVLSILIPAYNVENYLSSCVSSILNIKSINKIEVIIVNDGSTDNTLYAAKQLLQKFNYDDNIPIKIVDKINGGHGSTINEGIKLATGKYFRIIDSDDWVNSNDLDSLINILEKEDSDIIVTDYSEDLIELNSLVKKELYTFMVPRIQYLFEDLCYDYYGFKEWGPILATGNFKVETLKKTPFKITEKSSYVDMEFNCYSIINAKTITYYPLDIYRYFIGRSDQSISYNSYKRKFKQHENILFNLLKIYSNSNKISSLKKKYILHKIILPMVKAHYIILYQFLKSATEFRRFDRKLKKYEKVYNNRIIKTKYISFTRKTKGVLIKFTPILIKLFKLIRKGK